MYSLKNTDFQINKLRLTFISTLGKTLFLAFSFILFLNTTSLAIEVRCQTAINVSQATDLFKRRLFQSKRLIFSNEKAAPDKSRGFIASNEFDFYRSEIDRRPTDILIAYGTNSAWDIAVRKNAKVIVLGDFASEPLIIHEYLLRPLLALSKTPRDFVYLINKSINNNKVQTEQNLYEAYDKVYDSAKKPVSTDLINKLTAELSKMGFTPLHINFVRLYLENKTDQISKMYNFRSWSHKRMAELHTLFNERYDPYRLLEKGAKPDIINQKDFSFLSSQKSFNKLKNIAEKNMFFMQTTFDDIRSLKAVKNLINEKYPEMKRISLSLTNILDVLTDSTYEKIQSLEKLSFNIFNTFKTDRYDLLLTTNYQFPHDFFSIPVQNKRASQFDSIWALPTHNNYFTIPPQDWKSFSTN